MLHLIIVLASLLTLLLTKKALLASPNTLTFLNSRMHSPAARRLRGRSDGYQRSANRALLLLGKRMREQALDGEYTDFHQSLDFLRGYAGLP